MTDVTKFASLSELGEAAKHGEVVAPVATTPIPDDAYEYPERLEKGDTIPEGFSPMVKNTGGLTHYLVEEFKRLYSLLMGDTEGEIRIPYLVPLHRPGKTVFPITVDLQNVDYYYGEDLLDLATPLEEQATYSPLKQMVRALDENEGRVVIKARYSYARFNQPKVEKKPEPEAKAKPKAKVSDKMPVNQIDISSIKGEVVIRVKTGTVVKLEYI